MREVESSMISAVGQEGDDLLVKFKNGGKTFRYPGKASHYARLCDPEESCGKYFHQNLRDCECEECG